MFNFIKYTQPAWQFNIIPAAKGPFPSCIVEEERCPEGFLDIRYTTKAAQLTDAGYRLWNKGVLLEADQQQLQQLQQLPKPTLQDEYIFIRKYWGTAWAAFALLLRLLRLHNPVTELRNFWVTRHIKRIQLYQDPVKYDGYETFQSPLLESSPLVAVIIPTLNRYDYLKDVLHDLEAQTYQNFEVVVVDQSDDFNKAFYAGFSLNVKMIQQKEKLLWTARNKAIQATDAGYLLFFDDDSMQKC